MIPFLKHTGPRGLFNLASHYAWNLSERKSYEPDFGMSYKFDLHFALD